MLRDLATWTTFPPETGEVLDAGLAAEKGARTYDELVAERDALLVAYLRARRDQRGGRGWPRLAPRRRGAEVPVTIRRSLRDAPPATMTPLPGRAVREHCVHGRDPADRAESPRRPRL